MRCEWCDERTAVIEILVVSLVDASRSAARLCQECSHDVTIGYRPPYLFDRNVADRKPKSVGRPVQ